jgi:hypothetical protein
VSTAVRELQVEGDEVKIKKLKDSWAERHKLISVNDALCENEHRQFEKSNNSKVKLGSNFDTNKMLDGTLEKRMTFFETLNTGTVGLKGAKSTSSLKFGGSGNGSCMGMGSAAAASTRTKKSNNNNGSGGGGGMGVSSSLDRSTSTSALINKLKIFHEEI